MNKNGSTLDPGDGEVDNNGERGCVGFEGPTSAGLFFFLAFSSCFKSIFFSFSHTLLSFLPCLSRTKKVPDGIIARTTLTGTSAALGRNANMHVLLHVHFLTDLRLSEMQHSLCR